MKAIKAEREKLTISAEKCIVKILGSSNRIEIEGVHHHIIDQSEKSILESNNYRIKSHISG